MLKNFRNSLVIFIITFLAGLLIFGVAALIVVPKIGDLLAFDDPVDVIIADEGDELISTDGKTNVKSSGLSILLVGTDYQPEVTPGAKVSADTIIFMTVSEETKSFVFMPFPSRTDVTVDGEVMFLGDAYGEKGIEYLCEKITGLTGITVNYYAVVSLSGMQSIVDKLGGVDFSVPVNMRFEDSSQDLVIDIDRGYQKLDGDHSVKMLRYRGDSFKDRTSRNLSFLQTAIRLCISIWPESEASELYLKLAPYVTTNFTESDLQKYASTIWAYNDYNEISLELPGRYSTNEDGYTIYIADTSAAYKMLNEYKN